jgi:hypothetical protein
VFSQRQNVAGDIPYLARTSRGQSTARAALGAKRCGTVGVRRAEDFFTLRLLTMTASFL